MLKMVMLEPKEPHNIYEPKPPEEFFRKINPLHLKYSKEYTVEDLGNLLPPNVKLDSLRFKSEEHYNCYDNHALVYYITIEPNKKYDSELKSYKKALAKYFKSLPEYKKEIEQYLEDVKVFVDWSKKENNYVSPFYKNIRKKYLEILEQLKNKL